MEKRVKWIWFCGAAVFFLIVPWVAQTLFGSTYISELLVQSMVRYRLVP